MRVHNAGKSFKIARAILPSYIRSLFRPIPIWANMILTRKCNLDCAYCFIKEPSKRELEEAQTKRVIDKLYSLGCRFIDFTGGEPTLRKDLPELVEYAAEKGMVTRITTNGTLLTSEYIEILARAGLDIINVSLDSIAQFDQSTKDYVRRKKSILDLLEIRAGFGFEIETNLTLTKKNLDRVIETITLMNELGIAIAICIIMDSTYSNAPIDGSLLFTTPEDKEKLFEALEEIKELKRRKYNIIDPIQYFDDIKKFENHELKWYCMAGRYSLAVDCDGGFQLCYLLPPENASIFDIDRSYYKKYGAIRQQRMEQCNTICLHNCGYDPSYFFTHPLFFLKEVVVNRLVS